MSMSVQPAMMVNQWIEMSLRGPPQVRPPLRRLGESVVLTALRSLGRRPTVSPRNGPGQPWPAARSQLAGGRRVAGFRVGVRGRRSAGWGGCRAAGASVR